MRLRKYVLLGAAAFLTVTFVFAKTQETDLEQHLRVVGDLRELKQLEATLNQDILKSRAGALSNYDPFVVALREIKERHRQLQQALSSVAGSRPEIVRHAAAYEELLAQREILLEEFKSESAVLQNSLRYFPVAVAQLWEGRGPGASLESLLHTLLEEILLYHVTGAREVRARVVLSLGRLARARDQSPPPSRPAIDYLITHARIILEKKDEVDGRLSRLLSLPIARRLDALDEAYTVQYEQAVRRGGVYRFYLYLVSVLLLSSIAYIMLRLQRSNAELGRRAAEQASLVETGRLLVSTLQMSEVLQRLAELVQGRLGVDIVRIWLQEGPPGVFRLHAQAGAPSVVRMEEDRTRFFTPGEGLTGWIMANRRSLPVVDVQADPRTKLLGWFQSEKVRSYLGVPLLIDGVPVGVLSCLSRPRRVWTTEEVGLVEALANSAAVAIRNAQLYAEAQAHLARMRRLTEVSHLVTSSLTPQEVLDSVTEAALDLLRGDMARLWSVDEEAGVLRLVAIKSRDGKPETVPGNTRLPIGQGLVGWVAAHKTKRYSPDMLSDPMLVNRDWVRASGYVSQLTVPLVVGERALGALAVLTVTEREFGRDEEELLELFAANAAAALENARLYQQARQAYEELSRTQEQLLHSQKIEAVGRLAGGVAHDFNNLLTVILGRSLVLLELIGAEDPVRRHAELIQKTAERAAALTRQLLAFSRKQVLQPRLLGLNGLVVDLAPMLQRLLGEDVRVTVISEAEPGPVRADPAQFEQVLMNLAVNARDAMPRGGRLTIETARVDLDDDFVRAHPGAQPGPHVMLAVSDTGSGMSAEVQARIFEPFFTTKEPGKGTGLGLSTVYGIVQQHDGVIAVESGEGRGTTFRIYLPTVEDTVDAALPGDTVVASSRGTEALLLVEDEEEVRALARDILEKRGYKVLEAANGHDALALVERHPGPIHLLITDVVMPEMGGRELAERLAVSHPAIRVLFMSGYTDDEVVHHGVSDHDIPFLQKPFVPDVLARRVREVLDARRAG